MEHNFLLGLLNGKRSNISGASDNENKIFLRFSSNMLIQKLQHSIQFTNRRHRSFTRVKRIALLLQTCNLFF